MRVLVCGSREWRDPGHVNRVLTQYHGNNPITCVISGGAKGVDSYAEFWAKENEINYCIFPAKWKKYGPASGPIRNKEMLDVGLPDIVIAFPGGPGTANMIGQSKKAGIKVIEVPQ